MDEPVISFETILDHKRNRRGQLEYLVKYSDRPIDEAQWIKEAHFTTTELIEEYWQTHSADEKVLN